MQTAVIDKGRREKRELTRRRDKKLRPLKSTFQRYADVFEILGFPITLNTEAGIQKCSASSKQKEIAIGIAPFARHEEKRYPLEKMKEVIRLLGQHGHTETSSAQVLKMFLFGGGEDAAVLNDWETEFENVQSTAGKMRFEDELQLISSLDLMISMDSANMHLASLYGVPVVSIWGGTHPWLGFYGWGQDAQNAVQVALDCRPSSVFGNKPCPRGDLACLNLISPITVYEKAVQQLKRDGKKA